MANELSYRDRKVTAQPAEAREQNYRPGIRTIRVVYDWEQVRESMVLNLPHPTLGDLDVPGSGLGADQDDVFADYVRAGDGR